MPHVPLAPAYLARELLKLIAVVVASAVAGLLLGIGLNHAFGTTKPSGDSPRRAAVTTSSGTTRPAAARAPAATSTPTPAARTTGTTDTTAAAAPAVPVRTTLDLGGGVSLRVTSASFLAATTPGGRAAKRARLTVRASMTNSGTAVVTAPVDRLVLRAADAVVRPVPAAADLAGALLQPLAPGATATGELHFETSGAATTALAELKRVAIRYGPQALITDVR
jgi:hypothetical protein